MILHVIIERRINNLRLWFLLLNNLSWFRKRIARTSIIIVINLKCFYSWRCNRKIISTIRVIISFIKQTLIVDFVIVVREIITSCKTIVDLSAILHIIHISILSYIIVSVRATRSVIVVGVVVRVVIASKGLIFVLHLIILVRGTLR